MFFARMLKLARPSENIRKQPALHAIKDPRAWHATPRPLLLLLPSKPGPSKYNSIGTTQHTLTFAYRPAPRPSPPPSCHSTHMKGGLPLNTQHSLPRTYKHICALPPPLPPPPSCHLVNTPTAASPGRWAASRSQRAQACVPPRSPRTPAAPAAAAAARR